MSFEDEWGAAKVAATRLNGLPGDPGRWSPGADLSVRQDHLGAIGHAAYGLHGRLVKDGNHARGDSGVAAGLLTAHHFHTGAALANVVEAWDLQLRTLLDAVGHISNHLDHSVASHAKDDAEVSTSLAVSKISEYFE
ncbi:hypothetical protein ACI2LJ_05190 [Streptomyces sp. NPDC088090]|uniref:hypothetical protein n=1 Tax=Streptomyces sp. NPDC088090 TaxID=3365822 RepID=UPI00384D3534